MPTSLISTGVQFPDSTIQTTAATAGAAPGLVLISTTAPTAATTVGFNTFSGTYDNYLIVFNNFNIASGTNELRMQVLIGGSVYTSDYASAVDGVGAFDYSQGRIQPNLAHFRIAPGVAASPDNRGCYGHVWVRNVNSTNSFKSINGFSNYYYSGNFGTNWYGSGLSGVANTSSVLSGFQFFWSDGSNFAARGSLKLYGYKNS
jgi:hypothetical protein